MKRFIIIFFLIISPAFAADLDYAVKRIVCEEQDEPFVSNAYDAFLTLLTKRELKKEALKLPVKLVTRTEDSVCFSWTYYISPNEQRGYEICVPKDCVSEQNGVLTSRSELVIAQDYTKQGIRVIITKKKERGQQPAPS